MTVTPHTDPHLTDQQRQTADMARGDADLVLEIAQIADEQIGETEDERTLRIRFQEALRSLRWDLGSPWSEHVVSADRVLRTPKGDLDEQRVCEFLSRVLDGSSAAEARHAMDRNVKQAKLAEARSGVAARLHGIANGQWGQPAPRPAREASPVRRGELPPAVVAPAEPARVSAPLPQRVQSPPEPMFPKAPPESPVEQTGDIFAALRRSGHDIPVEMEAAARKDGRAAAPAFGPPSDPAFSATALPQAVPVRSGDTQRMTPVRPDADEVLAELAMNDASVGERKVPGVRPFAAAAGSGGASRPAASVDGSAGDDDA
jgi:hypothetical protein